MVCKQRNRQSCVVGAIPLAEVQDSQPFFRLRLHMRPQLQRRSKCRQMCSIVPLLGGSEPLSIRPMVVRNIAATSYHDLKIPPHLLPHFPYRIQKAASANAEKEGLLGRLGEASDLLSQRRDVGQKLPYLSYVFP